MEMELFRTELDGLDAETQNLVKVREVCRSVGAVGLFSSVVAMALLFFGDQIDVISNIKYFLLSFSVGLAACISAASLSTSIVYFELRKIDLRATYALGEKKWMHI